MSFLIVLNNSNKIENIKWSDPIYLVSLEHTSFIDLIIDEEKNLILNDIHNSTSKLSYSSHGYSFFDYPEKIFLCFLKVNDKTLVFGYEDLELSSKDFMKVIGRFMETLKGNVSKDNIPTNDAVRFQFETINALNNELVDTKRLLEKSNITLSALNKDLNNRLVKDPLTGLVSKYQYRMEIDLLVRQNPTKYGIFTFIDIDDFKKVNDTYGHHVGDDYLVEFAKRLMQMPLTDSIELRIAGDEFGLFTYGLSLVDEVILLALWEKIQIHVLSKPIIIRGETIPLSISAGMSVYGKDTLDIYQLIEYADFAMYHAKKSGKNKFSIFDKKEFERSRLKG